jgi:HKD family nuclease
MQLNFIGHGLDSTNDNTVGNLLATSFQDPKFDSFISLVAFASNSGVRQLIPFIDSSKHRYKELTFYIGVDDNGTSKEALQQLIDNSIQTYIFHTQSAMIFHPKIYLFEGKSWTRLVVGSTNLTNSGLFVNVEAAVSMDFRPTDPQGKKIITQIKEYYQSLLDKTDKNIELLTNELLETLCKQGLVRDEINTRTKTVEQLQALDDLNIFPDRDKMNSSDFELGNADLPDEIQIDRNYDLQFNNADLEKFPYFFEKWLHYKNENPKSGGIVYRETDDRQLHSWFRKIKYLIGKQKEIPLQIMKQLEANGFPFENGKLVQRRIRWEERFEELVAYVKKHNLNYAHVPQHKNLKHPYASLGQWCAAQKLRRKGISPPVWTEYEEKKMNSINFKWLAPNSGGAIDDEKWLQNYFKLEDFKKKFGHANPSQTDKNAEIKKLAKWVNDQRTLRNTGKKTKKGIKKLIKEREELLTEIGVDWDWQHTQRKKELEEFIVGYLELRKTYPDEKPKKGDTRFSKILQKKAEIKFRYKNDTSPEGKWRVDRLNEIGFRWT